MLEGFVRLIFVDTIKLQKLVGQLIHAVMQQQKMNAIIYL